MEEKDNDTSQCSCAIMLRLAPKPNKFVLYAIILAKNLTQKKVKATKLIEKLVAVWTCIVLVSCRDYSIGYGGRGDEAD